MNQQDSLWKIIIEDIFEDFVEFFLPDVFSVIDFTKGYEFLDKEMETLFPDSEETKRYVDKLVKVYCKDGTESCLLIHADIQGYRDTHFAERMFVYFYRVFDRYRKPITALAIFTDDHPDYKPARFDYHCFNTQLTYQYNTCKIMDQNEQILIDSNNPFALVVLTGLYLLQSGKNEEKRYDFKKQLFRLLLQKNYPREKIHNLFGFIDGLLYLSEPAELQFKKDIEAIVKGDDKAMGIPAHLTNYGQIMYGKGIEQGIEQGKVAILTLLLMKKFNNNVPNEYLEKIKTLNESQINIITLDIFEMQDVTDLEKYLH